MSNSDKNKIELPLNPFFNIWKPFIDNMWRYIEKHPEEFNTKDIKFVASSKEEIELNKRVARSLLPHLKE